MKKYWKNSVLSVLFVCVMGLSCVSCGSDDSDGSTSGDPQSTLVDGINVNPKKLLELHVTADGDGVVNPVIHYTMNYDAHGKLIKVTCTGGEFDTPTDIAKIDYDLKSIDYGKGQCRFSVNSRGYISRIANCNLSYDEQGYLTQVEEYETWQLGYDGGNIVKAYVELFTKDNIDLYYIEYGEKPNEGELYFYTNINSSYSYFWHWDEVRSRSVGFFIAYQAGLFGKTTKQWNKLPDNNTAIFECLNERYSQVYNYRCTYRFQN